MDAFGLTKKQLISEVIRLRARLLAVQDQRDSAYQDYQETNSRYERLVDSGQEHLSDLMAQQKAIVDKQLGLDKEKVDTTEKQTKPIGRPSWRQVARDFERKDRLDNDAKAEHWKKKIDETEARDGVMN